MMPRSPHGIAGAGDRVGSTMTIGVTGPCRGVRQDSVCGASVQPHRCRALLLGVLPHHIFVDFDPEARAGGDIEVAVPQLELLGDDLFSERVFVDIEVEHRFVVPGRVGRLRRWFLDAAEIGLLQFPAELDHRRPRERAVPSAIDRPSARPRRSCRARSHPATVRPSPKFAPNITRHSLRCSSEFLPNSKFFKSSSRKPDECPGVTP